MRQYIFLLIVLTGCAAPLTEYEKADRREVRAEKRLQEKQMHAYAKKQCRGRQPIIIEGVFAGCVMQY